MRKEKWKVLVLDEEIWVHCKDNILNVIQDTRLYPMFIMSERKQSICGELCVHVCAHLV